jgi:hypothetical protein
MLSSGKLPVEVVINLLLRSRNDFARTQTSCEHPEGVGLRRLAGTMSTHPAEMFAVIPWDIILQKRCFFLETSISLIFLSVREADHRRDLDLEDLRDEIQLKCEMR